MRSSTLRGPQLNNSILQQLKRTFVWLKKCHQKEQRYVKLSLGFEHIHNTASLNRDLRWKKRSSKLHNVEHFCTVQSHLCSILRFLTCAPSSHLWRFMGSQFSPSMVTVRNFQMHFRTQPSKGKLFRMLPLTHWRTDWGSSDLLSSPTMLVKLSMEAVHNISYQ